MVSIAAHWCGPWRPLPANRFPSRTATWRRSGCRTFRPTGNKRRFEMADFVVLGEALIDLFGEPGQPLGPGSRFVAKPGGAPANVAAALGKLGASVGFVGKVGEDA